MKLYYSPGACSLAPHVVLREAGIPFDLVQVDLRTHKTKNGEDYYAINSKGYVPLLEFDNGEHLTEVSAIIQYLADQVPGKLLMPEPNTHAYYHALAWINFIATEIHKSFTPLFNASMPPEAKQFASDSLLRAFKWIDTELENKQYLLGETFTVADAYLFTASRWCSMVNVPLDEFKDLTDYLLRIRARPSVQEAMKVEGL